MYPLNCCRTTYITCQGCIIERNIFAVSVPEFYYPLIFFRKFIVVTLGNTEIQAFTTGGCFPLAKTLLGFGLVAKNNKYKYKEYSKNFTLFHNDESGCLFFFSVFRFSVAVLRVQPDSRNLLRSLLCFMTFKKKISFHKSFSLCLLSYASLMRKPPILMIFWSHRYTSLALVGRYSQLKTG